MAEFLPDVIVPSKHSCCSADDLAAQLRAALSSKVSETRVDHVFEWSVSESEKDTIEQLASINPSLREVPSGVTRRADANEQITRVASANDTFLDKLRENPVLQRAAVKHIIGAVSAADGSSWILREVSQAAQGWTFICHCEESLEAWNQQNSKNMVRPVIGEFSYKVDDKINLSRPAFDCRGSMSIAFVRSNLTISVKYEHTLIHKTVSQLLEFFWPPAPEQAPVPEGS